MTDAHTTGRGFVQLFKQTIRTERRGAVNPLANELVKLAERSRADQLAVDLLIELGRVY